MLAGFSSWSENCEVTMFSLFLSKTFLPQVVLTAKTSGRSMNGGSLVLMVEKRLSLALAPVSVCLVTSVVEPRPVWAWSTLERGLIRHREDLVTCVHLYWPES